MTRAPERVDDPTPPVPVVALAGIGRTFASDPPVVALQGVDLTVHAGEHLAIVGPSGSGKSTLLNVLGLLDRPTDGSYHLDGTDVATLGDRARAAARGERIGFVFQSFHLLAHRSALENVMLAGVYRGVRRAERTRRALEALDRVGVLHRAGAFPTRLSGGERQRVAVARAIAGRPSLLLCDEPTGNLDSSSTTSVLDLFDSLVADAMTLVVITHDDQVAARAGRVVRIVDGRMREVRAVGS